MAGNNFTENFTANVPVAGFIQAVSLMSVLEQRLSFWILSFVTHDHQVVVKCIWVSGSSVTGIFLSTFLQLANGSKNSILNSVTKLNLFMCSKLLKDFPFHSTIHLSEYCSQKECQKCTFQQYGDLTFKHPHKDKELSNNQTVKKLNLW